MTTDDQNHDHTDSFKAHLRSGLAHLADATPVRPRGEFDPDMVPLITNETRPPRLALGHRRSALAVAAAVVAVIGIGSVAVLDNRPDTGGTGAPAALDEKIQGVSGRRW